MLMFIRFSRFQNVRVAVELLSREDTVVLLPIYVCTYEYNSAEYEALVCGCTGKVVGTSPTGWGTVGWLTTKLRSAIVAAASQQMSAPERAAVPAEPCS
jgi:hypothetical protein